MAQTSYCCPHCDADLSAIDPEEWPQEIDLENACGVCHLPVLIFRGARWHSAETLDALMDLQELSVAS